MLVLGLRKPLKDTAKPRPRSRGAKARPDLSRAPCYHCDRTCAVCDTGVDPAQRGASPTLATFLGEAVRKAQRGIAASVGRIIAGL
jgi:hypothetical protein